MRTNPNALRLNISIGWRSKSISRQHNVDYIFQDQEIDRRFQRYFRRYQQKRNYGIIYSHTNANRYLTRWTSLRSFFYDGALYERVFEFDRKTRIWLRRLNKKKVYKPSTWKVIRARLYLRRRRVKRSLSRSIFRRFYAMRIMEFGVRLHDFIKFTIGPNYIWRLGIFPEGGMTANTIARYIIASLRNRFTMAGTVYRMIKGIKRNHFARGIMVHCSGRFSRRQRATFKKFKSGILRISSFSKNTDYGTAYYSQKFGACGVKVWFYGKKKNVKKKRRFIKRKTKFLQRKAKARSKIRRENIQARIGEYKKHIKGRLFSSLYRKRID